MSVKRNFLFGAFGPLIAATLLLASCQGETKPPEKTTATVRATTATFVEHRQTIALTGEVVAHVQANLAFRVSGQISEWTADVGSHVTVGEVLARLDPQEQKADVEASEASVRAAEAQVRQTSAVLERQTALLRQGFTTRRDFDLAQTAERTAKGALDAARAQLATARNALTYTELRAEADGVVTVRNAETGQVVQAAQTMYTVAQDGARDAIFDVYESLLFARPAEPKIQLALISDPSVKTTGTISEVSPTIDAATGTVRVKIAIDDTPDRMTLGSSVIGQADSQPVKVVILPWTALSALEGKPAVWVVDPKDSTVSLRAVTINSYETGRVLIASGIEEGEQVVIDGTKMLRPGLVVTATKEQAK
ncbi:efflux RND transporter periplasmic adaptor subunit [Pararhizobium sp. A13]|uniref:efflux RND transporter periplasmic adaptor subunit n=1 Tax=Pararhizobium sp. A13 TaxID=3133975 RepID=UPI0032540798